MSRQRLDIECAVREHRTATIQCFVFCSVRIHVHYDTRIVVSQVSILPTSVHHTSVVHNNRVPVCILVESQTTQVLCFRSVQHQITHWVVTTHTRNTLITDIGNSQYATVGQIGSIIKFQIRLFIFYHWLVTCAVQFYFKYIPTFVGLQSSKHHTVSIPMHPQVSDRRTFYSRFEHTSHFHITTQIRELNDFSIETATACRFLVTPVIRLSTQIRSHCLTGSRTDLITNSDDLVSIQQRVT